MTRSAPLGLVMAVTIALFAPAASAATIALEAFLDGRQEVPANGSLAIGIAQLMYDTDTMMLTIQSTVLGIETDVLTGFHIHGPADPGEVVNPPLVHLGTALWSNIPMLDGMAYQQATMPIDAATATALLADRTYLNVHTDAFPNGEIRGQITVVPVPEPGTAMLMALGLIGLARAGTRRPR